MPIQILGLRQYEDASGRRKTKEDFFGHEWRAPSVAELLGNLDHYVAQVTPMERYNIYYTAADCLEERGRQLKEQWVIPFDIDDIDTTRTDEYVDLVLNTLGLAYDTTGIVMSGHGLQLIVGIDEPITDKAYFKERRKEYRSLCDKIDEALSRASLPGHADPSVWSPARLLRLPGTMNSKENKPFKDALLIQGNIGPIKNPLEATPSTTKVESAEKETKEYTTALNPNIVDHLKIDPEGVRECEVFKWMKNEPNEVAEPIWYASLSILGRVSNEIAHEYSQGYANYNREETDDKIAQAVEASGPVTCEHFNTLWRRCNTCAHQYKVKSPISIKGPNFIRTKDIGFRTLNLKKDPPVQGKPDYDDLYRFFYQQHPYISLEEYREVYAWDGKRWTKYAQSKIKEFAEIHVDFKPLACERTEFLEKVLANHMRPETFLNPYGFANFPNGTMRLPGAKVTGEMEEVQEMEPFKLYPHRMDLGMTYILPFEYDAKATCPRFETFMEEVTMGDKSLIAILQEFMGYALSNADAELGERALFLLGEGSNGKSVFLDVMKWLAGKENFSSVPLSSLDKETGRFELHGRMFNVTEETPRHGLKDSSVFKNLVTGGTMTIKQLYKNIATVKNNSKFIMAANELPHNTDTTRGMFRKILIVPFNATFEGKKIDRKIRQKLKDELPGIFNWAIDGYNRLQASEYHFTTSSAVEKEVHQYEYLSDPLKVWARDHLEDVEPVHFTPMRELYMSYVNEMEISRQKASTLSAFGIRLRRLYKFKKYERRRVDDRKATCVYGLKLVGRREF